MTAGKPETQAGDAGQPDKQLGVDVPDAGEADQARGAPPISDDGHHGETTHPAPADDVGVPADPD
ncbi:MAG: hypothetical protein AVDCRST_MAG50-2881 [uncultured Acidimicrobiales bacterium]|uniref:Uncharacterized protein n=1 Tax=uncultured Acidimicrobiales bacterium TaxID=310071 RepID=A0A6J4IZ45_9ACTN|nr:MAG: hypothetical protein AVDCRST_MAG50-2881 [uncultured Acidimicrobiales bacterium]